MQHVKGPAAPRIQVVIENHDSAGAEAVAKLLRDAGCDAVICTGPRPDVPTDCPLLDGEDCELLATADVVLHDLDLDRSNDRSVLLATRQRYPHLPIVAEVSTSQQREYSELLDGVTVTVPYSPQHIREAVVAAVAVDSSR